MRTYDSYKDSGIEWIGEIPSHWVVPQLNFLISGIKDGTHGTHERVSEGELLLSSKNVTDKGLIISEDESRISLFEHEQITKNGFPIKGDVLLTIVGSIGRSCVYEYDLPISFQRSVCFVRTNMSCFSYYLKYYFVSNCSQYQLSLNTKTSTQGGIYINDLKRLNIPLPPLSEQEQIVSYLDEKTSLIDEMVEKKKRKIELLKEYRTSLINTVVTKGLNPDIPMKDSGIEWIGEIPRHWSITPIKYTLNKSRDSIRTGPFGSSLKSDDFVEEGIRVYNQRSVYDEDFSKSDIFVKEDKFQELKGFIVLPGDVLVTSRGTIGKMTIVPDDGEIGILHPCLIRLRISHKVLIPRYLWWYINHSSLFILSVKIESNSTTIEVIYSETLSSVRLPIPPISEQEQIVSYLDEKTSEIDKTIELENKKIELLNEYRQSLISNVVTGKIKVVSE